MSYSSTGEKLVPPLLMRRTTQSKLVENQDVNTTPTGSHVLLFPNIEPNNIVNEEEFISGKFEYMNENERVMFVNAWQAITLTDNWDFIKEDTKGFMFSDDPQIDIISKKMVELGYDGHSGSSFAITMRVMQYIAKYGEQKFKEDYLLHR
jgi:hypothetical protein